MKSHFVDLDALEPEQRTAALLSRVPRKPLGRPLVILLLALRIYVVCTVALAAIAFWRALH
jgi:hypothetical protein